MHHVVDVGTDMDTCAATEVNKVPALHQSWRRLKLSLCVAGHPVRLRRAGAAHERTVNPVLSIAPKTLTLEQRILAGHSG